MNWKQLTLNQRMRVLESHMFIKMKRDGKIKERNFTEGNKKRSYITKEDESSPIVATELVLLTYIINAEENREVAVTDIPNASRKRKG